MSTQVCGADYTLSSSSTQDNVTTSEAVTSVATRTTGAVGNASLTSFTHDSKTSPISTTTAATAAAATPLKFNFKECLPLYVVAGGLILACLILLFSTLLLACKVCQLNRRLKTLSSDSDMISNCAYKMQTFNENTNKSEPEAKETSILMADIDQTQRGVGNGATKEEGGKVNEGGQVGEEKKEADGTADSEEASTGEKETVAENPPSPQLQEDATNSTSTSAVAASSSEGAEEPKDVK